jgi:hypothetical protein
MKRTAKRRHEAPLHPSLGGALKPRLHLDGAHARDFHAYRVGHKVRFTVDGKIKSLSQSSHPDGHGASIEVEKIAHHGGGKK